MTPAERVARVLHRQPVDRTPVDLWLTPEALRSLRQQAGCADEAALWAALEVDKIHWASPPYRVEEETLGGGGHGGTGHGGRTRTMWGATLRRMEAGAATYDEVEERPLAGMEDVGELADYPWWPDPERFDVEAAVGWARSARERGYPVMGPWVSVLEIYCQMRGLEDALADLVVAPEFAEAAMGRIFEIQTRMLERFLPRAAPWLDLLFISDDVGSQEAPLISPAMWDRFLHERVAAWCALAHRHGVKAMFHTDGAVRPLLPRIAACGVDVLNPIQHVCAGMGRTELKRDFGDRLVFYGGVENQRVLPFGSVADVRREVRECLRTLGAGGGYICCSCHNIQAGTPVDNILALVRAVREG